MTRKIKQPIAEHESIYMSSDSSDDNSNEIFSKNFSSYGISDTDLKNKYQHIESNKSNTTPDEIKNLATENGTFEEENTKTLEDSSLENSSNNKLINKTAFKIPKRTR